MPSMSDFLARLESTPVGCTVEFDPRSGTGLCVTPIEKAGDVWYRADALGIEPVMSLDPFTAVSRATQAALTGRIAI